MLNRAGPQLIALCLFAFSSATLCGWIFHVEPLVRPVLGLITIKANTALAFSLSALAILCLLSERNRSAKTLAIAIFVLAALSFFENCTGHDLGIDQLLAADPGFKNGFPGRMAQHTALGFMVVGIAFIFKNKRLFNTTFIEISGYFVCLIGLISVIGYAYDVPALYQPTLAYANSFTGVSLNTALLFICLGANLLALRRDYWFASLWTSNTHGGELLRTFIPIFIGLPIALGFIKAYLEKAGILSDGVAFALIVITMVVASVTVMTRLSARFDHIDRARAKNEAQKQDLFYALAHDMKIPLIGSDKMLELILSDQISNEDVRKSYLEMVKQSNESLLWMIQNLIYENQREKGLELTTRKPTNLSELIAKSVDQIKPFAKSKDIKLHLNLVEDLTVDVDPEAIRLVLINVLHNAVKFTNRGSISLSCIEGKDEVVIEVSDTGIGIAPANQSRIFERTWQSDSRKRESSGGTSGGLGLHLCRDIMSVHGGQIAYRNRDGGGSVFSLTFPNPRVISDSGT